MRRAVKDSYRRLLRPSIVSELAASAKERSDDAAIALFADNVRELLMEPPLGRKRVMGVDPGLKSGCKLACLDEQGNVMAVEIIYPATDYYKSADLISFPYRPIPHRRSRHRQWHRLTRDGELHRVNLPAAACGH